jgi:hypothetical protein
MPRAKRPKAETEEERRERKRVFARAWKAKNPGAQAYYRRALGVYPAPPKQSERDRLAVRRVNDKRRYHSDVGFKMEKVLRTSLLQALRLHGNGQKTNSVLDLIGCTTEELVTHLEAQFKDGMSWENHAIDGWHIDHKLPCASFDLSDPEQQKACFHYTNLQPLWAAENQSKGTKVAA